MMLRLFLVALAALALLAGCKQPAPAPSPTPAPLASTLRKHRLHTPTPSPAPTHTASPTSAPTASPVALPSFALTPAPTASPAPTAAPLLTPPPSALPTPTDPPPVGNTSSGSFTGNGSAGGTVSTPTPAPTPSPTPPATLAQPYNPSYVYQGTETSGGGGNDCGGSLCITGPMMANVNIAYLESVGMGSGSPFYGNSASACNDGVSCKAVFYNSLGNMGCSSGTEFPAQYNAWDAHDTTSSDPDFLHDATPPAGTLFAAYRDGQFNGRGNLYNTCANNTHGVWINVNDPSNQISSEINTAWFNSASFINSDPNVCTRWDNGYIDDTTVEFGGGTFTALNNFIKASALLYAKFPFCQLVNNGAHGAGPYAWNNPGSSGSSGNIAFACNNGVCNDIDDWCANATSNMKAFQFERSITSGNTAGVNMISQDLPYVLDTLSHMYAKVGCNGIAPFFLDATNYNNADDRFARDDELAQRLLALRGHWTQSMPGVMEHRFLDCSGCINRVSIEPEDNIVAFPLDAGMGASAMSSAGDGNGCHTGDSGGAVAYLIACVGTDYSGQPGAIYARAFTIYIKGVLNGTGVLLDNQSNQVQTIQNAWCHIDGLTQDCSAYTHYWHYGGDAEQTCYNDTGLTNAGTTSATCSPASDTLSPGANGGTGFVSENLTSVPIPGMSTAMQLGVAPTGTTVQTQDSMILLLSQ